MNKKIIVTSVALMVWFFASAVVHLLPHQISDQAQVPLLQGAEIAPPVAGIFESACANCHSEKTRWPWYSQLAPVSWLVENDVREARKHMNLSQWDRLDVDEERLLLTAIATEIQNGEMPPRRYVVLHPEAKLSMEAAGQIIEWTRSERHRLKFLTTPDSMKSPSQGRFVSPRASFVLRQIKSD